jgi:hypothetical protein
MRKIHIALSLRYEKKKGSQKGIGQEWHVVKGIFTS